MEQQVTHDALVKFAAEKLGILVRRYAKNEWYDLDNYEIRKHGVGAKPFDLTSWDLMGKGLAVFQSQEEATFVFTSSRIELEVYIDQEMEFVDRRHDGTPSIPLAFWKAWYEVEQQNAVDNPTGRSIERTDVST